MEKSRLRNSIHIRVFAASIVFFTLQAVAIVLLSPAMLGMIKNSDYDRIVLRNAQRRVLQVIRNIETDNANGRKGVYIFGGSSALEFLPDDARLSELAGHNVRNCATNLQFIVDTIRLVSNIKTGGGTVVFTMSPFKFADASASQVYDSWYMYGKWSKYIVESDYVDHVMKEDPEIERFLRGHDVPFSLRVIKPLNPLIYMGIDYAKAVRDSMQGDIANFRLGYLYSNPYPVALYDKWFETPISPRVRAIMKKGITKRIGGDYEEKMELNFYLLEKLLEVSRLNGHELVLMDLPQNREFTELFPDVVARYRQHLDDFMRTHPEVRRYMADPDRYEYRQEDFHDMLHLNPKGRAYYEPYIADSLRSALKGIRGEDGR